MKVLYLYSDKTGLAKSPKRVDKILTSLREIYSDLTIKKTENIQDFEQNIRDSAGIFDILIVAGGDGTLKIAINILMSIERSLRPTLGYLPCGTINDAGRAIGVRGSIKQALRILNEGNIEYVDVPKVNNEYFFFVCAIGAYSDISYITKRNKKKFLGRFAYYFDAIPKVFTRKSLTAHIETKERNFDVKAPFLMIMNSKNVGGFPVNFHYSVKDGLVEVYITKPGLLNGLLHYLFFKIRVIKIKTNYIKITPNTEDFWCFDGERGTQGSVEISVLKQELKVIGKIKK